ncbi:GDSL esterase/lipase [Acorus calamus]|uniref:GDSL esterase/lipase n=1 Tax=Acorus calamus TaxID=4465 RepID=A0AAV9F7U0_ACOCL|nr:GDSL esterase/lipase [Acorus calamus]
MIAPLFPAVIGFGDSILDTGNNNALFSLAKCDFPPYGREFIGGRPTGRFSNGKVPLDLFASQFGVKEVVPAYLGTELSAQDLLTGVSFASGGTGYDSLTAEMGSVLSMWDELELFKEYQGKLKAIAGEAKAVEIVSESFYVVTAGSNDVANTYFTARKAQYDVPSYAEFLVQTALHFIKDLHSLGARKIAVASVPPMGCVPYIRTLYGGFQRECVPLFNHLAMTFNSKFSMELLKLNDSLPGSKIVYIDVYTIALDLIEHPSKYGFEESTKGCCSTGNIEVSVLCNSLDLHTCMDDSKYVFWDSVHPTQRAYEIIVNRAVQDYIHLLV